MKPEGAVIDATWRAQATVRVASITEADQFIAAHYLGKRPAIVLLCLIAEYCGEAIGCIVYSAPAKEISVRYGGLTWELARLYLLDDVPKNAETWLIGKSVKEIKRRRKDVQFLVSYADPSAGHVGTIYRAANWKDDGATDAGRKTPRCDYYDARNGKKYGRRGNMPTDAIVERRPRVSKRRFVLKLDNRRASAI